MSEGPQGVQGEQGVRGLQGPGGGTPGPRGAKGEPGENGHVGRKVKWSFVSLVAVAFAVSLVQGYQIRENRQIIERVVKNETNALETHAALCTFRADLQRRADNAADFIHAIETGKRPPIEGISVNDLQRSLDGQEATLKSLAPLVCEDPE